MLMVKPMKKMLRQTFSVFEPEQCLEMRNYKYSFNLKFHHILADGTGVVVVFVFCFVLVHPGYSKFCVTIINRDEKVSVLFDLRQN